MSAERPVRRDLILATDMACRLRVPFRSLVTKTVIAQYVGLAVEVALLKSTSRGVHFFHVEEVFEMQLVTVKINKPEATNFILGQTHFIKSVEDLHEALVASVPGIKFGVAFCEASGKCLVRWSGTDPAMVELAQKNAKSLAAGHCFIVFLGDGFYPLNVLNTIKMVPEVCRLFCATANPTEVILAETEQGRGILGVVDGFPPRGIEGDEDIAWRKNLLRQIGYKLS